MRVCFTIDTKKTVVIIAIVCVRARAGVNVYVMYIMDVSRNICSICRLLLHLDSYLVLCNTDLNFS